MNPAKKLQEIFASHEVGFSCIKLPHNFYFIDLLSLPDNQFHFYPAFILSLSGYGKVKTAW